jgi:hypothetical protein
MSLELVSVLASVGTFIVIAATAIAAVIQLRHMRNSNQLEGLLNVLARVENASFNHWVTEAQQQLPQMLADPRYRQSVLDNTYNRDVSWLNLANSYEWVGSLVKNRLIPEDSFMDVYSGRVLHAWSIMEPMAALIRSRPHSGGKGIWENFEYLAVRAEDWARKHAGGTYPKRARRMDLSRYSTSIYPSNTSDGATSEAANVS